MVPADHGSNGGQEGCWVPPFSPDDGSWGVLGTLPDGQAGLLGMGRTVVSRPQAVRVCVLLAYSCIGGGLPSWVF